MIILLLLLHSFERHGNGIYNCVSKAKHVHLFIFLEYSNVGDQSVSRKPVPSSKSTTPFTIFISNYWAPLIFSIYLEFLRRKPLNIHLNSKPNFRSSNSTHLSPFHPKMALSLSTYLATPSSMGM